MKRTKKENRKKYVGEKERNEKRKNEGEKIEKKWKATKKSFPTMIYFFFFVL